MHNDNSNGDNCHYDIFNFSKNQARDFWKAYFKNQMFVCTNDNGDGVNQDAAEIQTMFEVGVVRKMAL